jgi:phospho-N-acetylmuramoyl-pentapeptide-transferase
MEIFGYMFEFQNPELVNDFIFLLLLAAGAFVLTMILTPVLTHFLYKYKFWKVPQQNSAVTGDKTPIYHKLHAGKHRNIPTMAGILIVFVVIALTLIFNLSRSQTFLPLFTIASFAVIGIINDYMNVRRIGTAAGISSRLKWILLLALAAFGAWWFYSKLGWDIIHVPAIGDFDINWWYVPLFMLVIVSTANAVNITDGLDGLAGGLTAMSFGAFGAIAFARGQVGLAVFCGTVMGALLAYTWFNIYPARFFMGDTGSLALGATLGVVAMLTNSVLVLPIIGLVFVLDTGSSLLQITSKKLFKRKIWPIAPLHHYLEYRGWPETKVTMRFWVIGAVFAIIGLALGLIGRG